MLEMMKKVKIRSTYFFCSLVFIAASCSDLIEESIEKKIVTIISPVNGEVSKKTQQTFWWETLDGALKYRLQVVHNKFDSIPGYNLDTLISKNTFTTTLTVGIYQWRVEAVNGSSKTLENTIQNLRIE
jgi:hypothetical protein